MHYTDFLMVYFVYDRETGGAKTLGHTIITQAHERIMTPEKTRAAMSRHALWLTDNSYGTWWVQDYGRAGKFDDFLSRNTALFTKGDQVYREAISLSRRPGLEPA